MDSPEAIIMTSSVLDLQKQLPDILRALKRREKIVVSYGRKKLALLQPLSDDADRESDEGDVRKNPAFGMWRDREEFADPAAFVRAVRRGRDHAL